MLGHIQFETVFISVRWWFNFIQPRSRHLISANCRTIPLHFVLYNTWLILADSTLLGLYIVLVPGMINQANDRRVVQCDPKKQADAAFGISTLPEFMRCVDSIDGLHLGLGDRIKRPLPMFRAGYTDSQLIQMQSDL